jgi:hypothetical protein
MARGRIQSAKWVSGTVRIRTFFHPTRGTARYTVVLYRGRPHPMERPCATIGYDMPIGAPFSTGDFASHHALASASIKEAIHRESLRPFDADWEDLDDPRLAVVEDDFVSVRPHALAGLDVFDPKVIIGERVEDREEIPPMPDSGEELQEFVRGFHTARSNIRPSEVFYEATKAWQQGYMLAWRLIREGHYANLERVDQALSLRLLRDRGVIRKPRASGYPITGRQGSGYGTAFFRHGRRVTAKQLYKLYALSTEAYRTAYGLSTDGVTLYSYDQPIAQKIDLMDPKTKLAYVDPRVFSRTTTRHQNEVIYALGITGWVIQRKELGPPR